MKKSLFYFIFFVCSLAVNAGQNSKVTVFEKQNIQKQADAIQSNIVDTKRVNMVQNSINEMHKVVDAHGNVKRGVIQFNQQRLIRNSVTSPLMKQMATSDTTFYESFEAYNDTANKNWIPTNWTELNKTGNTYTTGTTNLTWAVRDIANSATDGKNIAWVNYNNKSVMRDEWLVSPSFTPAAADYFSFDLYYAPFWMYFDAIQYEIDGTQQFNFSKPTTTMQVMISTDDGANWTKLWDAHANVGNYTETTIYDYQNGAWNTFVLPITDYIGKTIRIAFRYFGKNGDSMGLDNISVRQLKPQAKYGRPTGYFYMGLTTDYGNASADLMLGAPSKVDIWKNNSNQDAQNFEWTFEDPTNDKATITSTEVYPIMSYPVGFYGVPSMKAISGAYQNTYKWGTATAGAFFIMGGNGVFDWGTLGACNYDLNEGFNNYTFTNGDYIFGTNPERTIESVANYFEKPKQPYLLDSLWINLGALSAPAGTVFKLNIRKIDETGGYTTILAKATCTLESVKESRPGYYTMLFKNFITYDPVLELEVTNEYIEISDAILVELTGFNKTGIKLSAFSQGITDGGESNAYVFYNHYASGKRYLLSANDYFGGSTSLLFNLASTYTYLIPDATSFEAPIVGGSKTFNITSFSAPDTWWLETELPSWLSAANTYDDQTGKITYTLTAEPLPAGVEGRGTVITVAEPGATMSISVTQGNYTDVKNTKTTKTNVIKSANSVELNYTNEFKTLSIYNVSGQKLTDYPLSPNGKMNINTSTFKQGIYFFQFQGSTNETIKIAF
jgi:hypothetical protein